MIKQIVLAIMIKNVDSEGFEIWFQRRSTQDELHGLWELPGGKIDTDDESAEFALLRELKEETSWVPKSKVLPFKIFHFKKNDIILSFNSFIIHDLDQFQDENGAWFKIKYDEELNFLGQIPPLNVTMLGELKDYLKSHYQYFYE